MDQTLKEHEELIDKHDDQLTDIRNDLTDIRTRLGIKDLTNGQVVEYQKQLVTALDNERLERKEYDHMLKDDIKSLDDKVWFIVTGIIISIILEVALFVLQTHI